MGLKFYICIYCNICVCIYVCVYVFPISFVIIKLFQFNLKSLEKIPIVNLHLFFKFM